MWKEWEWEEGDVDVKGCEMEWLRVRFIYYARQNISKIWKKWKISPIYTAKHQKAG